MRRLRVLGAVRLSRLTDESTSVERQRQQIKLWAELHGHTVVHITTDTDVSGSVSPFKRRGLGPWLTEDGKVAQWDVLVTAKLDRATRSVRDLAELIDWCEKNDKSYASVSESFDLSGAAGRMVANVIASVAQFERERIGERRKESAKELRALGRWDGGMVPYGYLAMQTPAGWALEHDPETYPVARRIVETLIDGSSLSAIARELNAEGIPTAKYGKMWRPATVSAIVTSRTLLGEYGGVERFPPILTRREWDLLQAALKANSKPHAAKHSRGSLLLRVAFCTCGAPLYRIPTRRVYYRCAQRCGLPGIPAGELEALAVEALIEQYGNEPYMKRVTTLSENAQELQDVQRRISELDEELQAGTLSARAYARVIGGLEDKRDALAVLPDVEATERWEPTGETVWQRWEALAGETERGAMLRSLGAKIIAWREDKRVGMLIESGEMFAHLGKLMGFASGKDGVKHFLVEPARETLIARIETAERLGLGHTTAGLKESLKTLTP